MELEKIVKAFCEEQSLNFEDDVFQELSKIGFSTFGVKFKKPLAGMILVDENTDTIPTFASNKVIFYNGEYNLYDIRFIVLHELAHYIYEKSTNKNKNVLIAKRDHTVSYSEDVDEQEKDYMAAAMLLPLQIFIDSIKNYLNENGLDDDLNEENCKRLINDSYFVHMIQRKYRVSSELVKRRIEEVYKVEN
ncbi:MAG: ImmA/IrrE family metallo-endopeptidase [Clostridiales bacterium]|nr:ImmA/IrrE family metallo-endopeptidase [Clostridiales bacterium]